MIRNAKLSDKHQVLKFCQNTFSWGDYVEHVWDFWLAEDFLFVYEKESPIGICHAFFSKNQVWIEGIRVDPNFRKQKIASDLVKHVESIGRKDNVPFSFMLIDTENHISLSMAKSLEYEIFQTWNFYSLEPEKNSNFNIFFANSLNEQICTHYVKSWRWLPLDTSIISEFSKQNKIIQSKIDDKTSTAILSDSEHFEKTLIVTLFSGSEKTTLQILLFLQNHAMENNYSRIQILTKEKLPNLELLEHKLSFHLLRKKLD
ncbi:phospholipiddiacylglycerol acyltransferase protein [Marine Group I thaumarchaeote SCGC AAA799-P11]|uniref:Phospholipiddiacylglycerol acyltransferase protein n=1 Tax=Marine Group I thaumarchaeote SCGC AAA799-P11 TaxID=1502295 RepID=A0A087RZN6_9ARCH|nr:phospholipiddiacylglycerol acyltransferase protein [Marine Group I thaumarchaeote SCGC AAA799-P11]